MAKKDETNEEVVNGEDVVGTGNDARVALLNAINDRLDRERADELADVNDDETTTAFVAPELTEEEQGQRELNLRNDEDGTVAAELARAEAEANQTGEGEDKSKPAAAAPVKVKVGDRELSTEEIANILRENEAAKAEAKRIKDEAAAAAAAPKKTAPTEEEIRAAEAAELEERRALVRAIQMGTEEEAMNAITQLEERSSRRRSVDAEATARLVDERMSFKEAATWFATEYDDIVSDPTLRDLALKRDQDLVAAGDRRPYRERYQEIGESLRTWVSGLRKPSGAQPADGKKTDSTSTELPASGTVRQERKVAAAAHAAPSAASPRAPKAAGSGEDKEESASEVIAKMAQARGGPQWLRG